MNKLLTFALLGSTMAWGQTTTSGYVSIKEPGLTPPATVKVPRYKPHSMRDHSRSGYDVWVLRNVPNFSDDRIAQSNCETRVIKYRMTYDTGNSVLHELMHAGTCVNGIPETWLWNSNSFQDHDGIYLLADYLDALIKLNPKLIAWLQQERK